jgi:hypothetical protein
MGHTNKRPMLHTLLAPLEARLTALERVRIPRLERGLPSWTWVNGVPGTATANTDFILSLNVTGPGIYADPLPAGWDNSTGAMTVPAGVYAVSWYWDTTTDPTALGSMFDNYITMVPVDPIGDAQYMVAAAGRPGGSWGGGAITARMLTGASISFNVYNTDSADHQITNIVQIVQLV